MTSTLKEQVIHLKDYTPSAFLIPNIDLCFYLDAHHTRVVGRMHVKHREGKDKQNLHLNGEKLQLLSIKVDGHEFSDYQLSERELILSSIPSDCQLEIEVCINPKENKELDGLYASKDILCTQNEPEGFRRIMYFLDRPDIMSVYTTTLIADKKNYPLLLSNGNKIKEENLSEGLHKVIWHDPFPKPCYLFALVAGDLGLIKDQFSTQTGRVIQLEIYSDKGNEHRLDHAMNSLKHSMAWDEKRFGLEYDLDIYMIVAVDAFNMGAMENKGLNIFNSSCTLAHPLTATDQDFLRVEGVIAHEYFHNWTGNRVTCRDWFQLTLKEGLTVFRDQEFSSDRNSRAVKRIEEVNQLRSFQFPEDAGPNSHPIKPCSYRQINNFYTSTIYDKGSEVIRMIHTLIGEAKFRKGMDKYFELYDGQAVTTEDFINAMQVASGFDFTNFKRWYHQKGTPLVIAKGQYNSEKACYTLELEQQHQAKDPLVTPLKCALFDQQGKKHLHLQGEVLVLDSFKQSFIFENIPSKPIPSLNRDFSAPIKLSNSLSTEEMLFLIAHEDDPFNLWECTQLLASYWVNASSTPPEPYFKALERVLESPNFEEAFKALALSLPSLSLITDQQSPPLFEKSYQSLKNLKLQLSKALEKPLFNCYQKLESHASDGISPEDMGKRALKNTCLGLLCQQEAYHELALKQFEKSNNLTCELAALQSLAVPASKLAPEALSRFYSKWHHETLVIQKWFALQASCPHDDTLEKVMNLTKDPAFDMENPNVMRSLIGSFSRNPLCFNAADGSGYDFIGKTLLQVDNLNPQMAALLAKSFNRYNKLDDQRKGHMHKVLSYIIKEPKLSKNTFEIVEQCLQS